MKKLIFILMMALLPFVSSSQPLFGYTPSEIRSKYPNANWQYKKWGNNMDMLSMSFEADDLLVIYFFNKKDRSVITTIAPLTQGELQSFIETYNQRYVIVDSYTWKFYDEGNIFLCELKTTAEGGYYFMWSVYE